MNPPERVMAAAPAAPRPLWRVFAVFLAPMLASNILQSLSGTLNNIYLGQMLGVKALAAVSGFFPVMFFFIAFVIGLGAGSSVLIGQAWGAGEPAKVKAIAGTALTLGVLALAGKVSSDLQEAIRRREVGRTYSALAEGRFRSRTGTIDAPIGRASRKRHRMSVNGASPREARTHFEVVESLRGRTLLEVRLETGRTHQIRVHLAAIGHRVVGDDRYQGVRESIDLHRPFLHAEHLGFDHPTTGERVSFDAPLPPDLQTVLDTLS